MMWILMILGAVLGWVAGVHLPWYGILGVIALHLYLIANDKLGEGLLAIPFEASGLLSCAVMVLSGLIYAESSYGGIVDSIKFIFTGG